jgi:hypothetical protein
LCNDGLKYVGAFQKEGFTVAEAILQNWGRNRKDHSSVMFL